MKELTEKLVDLRVKLTLAEKRFDESTDVEEVKTLGEEMKELKDEINQVEQDIANEETETTEEEVPTEEKEEAPVEEPKDSEPTAEEIERSADWTKVDENNLKQVGSFEQRGGKEMKEERIKFTKEQMEARAIDLKENRSITVTSSNILLPSHESSELATAPFKQYSSLVDRVKTRNFNGGESYKAPFTKSYGTAGLTTEGNDYTDAEPVFDEVEMSKVKMTAYAEMTEEVEKLPSAEYVAEVEKGVNIALKKKIAQQIILGSGATNTFVGIFSTNAANKCVLTTDDLTIDSIDKDTLTDIVFQYGGDEEVEGVATLLLNKLDLMAFAKLRKNNGEKEHTINYVAQTIDGIPYIINSNITPLSAANSDDYVMAYGVPTHYELPIFSDVEVRKSYDFEFKKGKICYKADVFCAGNTTGYRGFIRVKKGSEVSA